MKYLIETERLTLSKVTEDDVSFIIRLLNSPGWLKFIGQRNVNTADDAKKYIRDKIINSYIVNGYGFYLVRLKKNGESAGICGFAKREFLDEPDLGFAFLPEYEGFGYAYEAALSCVDFANNVLKLKKISAITVKSNIRSIKLLEKLKMTYDKTITDPGDKEELYVYINH